MAQGSRLWEKEDKTKVKIIILMFKIFFSKNYRYYEEKRR